MRAEPEMIADYPCETGEGPLWHPTERRLYWVDIPPGHLYRYDPASGRHERCYDSGGEAIGGFTVQADGALLLLMARGAARLWREGTVTTLWDSIPEERDTRFNDVIADPEGRVFGGTMGTPQRPGRQYRIEPDGSRHVVLEAVHVPNGMGFTPDGRSVYFTDTHTHEIDRFAYDRRTGALSDRRPFARVPFEPGEGGPDGMTVDADGYVWSARWDGSCLVRYSPQGEEVLRIPFPVRKVSSVTFGGEDYTEMYVTTAGGHLRDAGKEPPEGRYAGALFRLRLDGVRGVPEFTSRILLSP
jgi:sugar lactone lactonase YvrE